MIEFGVTTLIIASLAAAALGAVRLVLGPRHADRIVALDLFLTAGISLCIAASLLTARTVYLDVAIGLALVGFVGTIGWARLVDRAARRAEGEVREL
ncbi:MAG: hypothetical protein KF724_02760 [Phycisphaeraceae bacterium]|nr:hypothetical protein [Phycisphaeraceae bacterium]